MTDLLIKNAHVIDGSGAERFLADIAVKDGLITHVDANINLPCKNTINGKGLVACPGFIDMHTHSDFTLLLDPGAESRVRQGVTTEVTGNCGGSPGPILASGRKAFMEYMTDLGKYYKQYEPDHIWEWKTLDDFYSLLYTRGAALNTVPLVGHSTLRANVMGYEDRLPTSQEIKQMKNLLHAELEKGAFGLSTGLIYHPGAFAHRPEITELASVVKAFDGIYSTHMRSESTHLFEAVEEALAVGRNSGVSLQISHLKAESPAMWGKSGMLLDKIDKARNEGVHVHFDQYPYTAYSSGLLEIFPSWAKQDGATRLIEFLSDPGTKKRIRTDMLSSSDDWENPMEGLSWNDVRVINYTLPETIRFNGLTVQAMAELKGMEPIEALFQVFLEEKGGLGMIVFAMSEDDLTTIMQNPFGMIGSDGCSVSPGGPVGNTPVHPRFYGTFPRVLGRYVREHNVISLEQAVRKMTGLPAEKLGLKDRGQVKQGMAADLVIFNPETIQDRATFDEPHQFPTGIEHVIVNGIPVVSDGRQTGALPGKRLSR